MYRNISQILVYTHKTEHISIFLKDFHTHSLDNKNLEVVPIISFFGIQSQ